MKTPCRLNIVSPLFWSFVSLAVTVIIIFIGRFANIMLRSDLLTIILNYIWKNLIVVFLISVLATYGELFDRFKKTIAIFSPLLNSTAAILIVYFVFGLLLRINAILNIKLITEISRFVISNTLAFFLLFLFFGYLKYIVNLFRVSFK